jgi:hypothetical protein
MPAVEDHTLTNTYSALDNIFQEGGDAKMFHTVRVPGINPMDNQTTWFDFICMLTMTIFILFSG